MTGTVDAVAGTNVKVSFGSEGDEPRWIPYANASSNYFYCMPDEGDQVFVYYERGDDSKTVCLGSRHVNNSPDFAEPKNKMVTANDKMIQFREEEIYLVGSRKELMARKAIRR